MRPAAPDSAVNPPRADEGIMVRKTPKYEKIKQYLMQGITAKSFTHSLPSENRLAEMFGVSRMTARKALVDLENSGLVERFPGRGTFIREQGHLMQGFFRIRPFRKWAEDINVSLTTRLLEARIKDPPSRIAGLLDYEGQVICIRRLNLFDETPVRLETRYLRADMFADILMTDVRDVSIHELLVTKYQVALTKMKQSLLAIGLAEAEAELFGEAPGFPVFHFERVSYSINVPIGFEEYFIRGDLAFNDVFTPQLDTTDFYQS